MDSIYTLVYSLDPKDILTLCVGLLALLVSFANVSHSILSKNADAKKSARAELASAVDGLIDLTREKQEIIRTLGEKWHDRSASSLRISLNDARESFLSRALFVIRTYNIPVSEGSYLNIASALESSGRRGEALELIKKGIEAGTSQYERLRARRSYGRMLILTGEIEEGRRVMISVADEYLNLTCNKGFDAIEMSFDCITAWRRLVWAQLGIKAYEYVTEDFNTLKKLINDFPGSDKPILQNDLNEIEKEMLKRGLVMKRD